MNEITAQPTEINNDPAAIAAAEIAKTRLQAAYQVAMARPRNTEQVRQNLLAACRRPRFAEKAQYSKPVGGGSIKGPSIRFAETALREWGNFRSDINVVYEDESIRRVQINITDFETNAQFTKEVTVRKTVERRFTKDREIVGERENSRGEKVYIVKATDEEIANKEAALISKAVRNEGLRLLPSDIIEEALDVAQETIQSQIKEDPDGNKRKIIDAFGSIGIKVSSLESFIGHEMESIAASEIAELRSIFSSIKDGEAKWADYLALKRKTESADEEERKSAVEALAALSSRKPKAAPKSKSKEAPKQEAPKEDVVDV